MTVSLGLLLMRLMTPAAWAGSSGAAASPASDNPAPPDAWVAVAQMTPGINIGNTLEATAGWETGWGNPPITKEYVQTLARLGFKTVRLPVAWDTYADNGRITQKQFDRVAEVVNWITDAGMFCVINIHWDGGWIDSDVKDRFAKTYHTFSPEAEGKFRSYWEQIAHHFAGQNEKLIFESLNEESTFDNEPKPYETLTRVNQLFVDTVRATGGNNANRLLIVAGYNTDIDKTCRAEFRLPKDTVRHKLLLSIHYYTPWQFVGLSEDAPWGKMIPTWGSDDDVKQLKQLFDRLNEFCIRNDTPVFLGEFAMCSNKDPASSRLWLTSVATAAVERRMVPVLWDTGAAVSRRAPYAPSKELPELLRAMQHTSAPTSEPSASAVVTPEQARAQFARPIVLRPDDKAAVPAPPAGFDHKRDDIPHGRLEVAEYDSKTVGTRRKMLVYLPPGYSAAQKYPVVYLLHGIGGNEYEWTGYCHADVILDNLIADGKAMSMIVVMPNGRAQKDDSVPKGNIYAAAPAFAVFERDLLNEVIPAVESRYGVLADRDHRALAGLSMGGGQTLNCGLAHTDLFAWLGAFSPAPNTKPPAEVLPDANRAKQLKLLWLSCGNRDGLISISQGVHAYLKQQSVPHVWNVDGGDHSGPEWSANLYLFAQRIFR